MGKMTCKVGNYRFEKNVGSNIVNIFNDRTGQNVDCFTQYDLNEQKQFEQACDQQHANYGQDWA